MPLTAESTQFTKDVLGRYICSTWDEATSSPEGIDVVVVGAGMYGGYCASKIYELSKLRFGSKENALRVLVLDAGPFVLREHTANIPNLGFYDPGIFNSTDVSSASNPGIRNEVWGVGWRSNQKFVGQAYCVGGKGIFWGGWCPRLQAADLTEWPRAIADYLTTVDPVDPIGFRPIDHLDAVTKAPLRRGDPLTGYEALEYEIGVLPNDRFVFDPVQIVPSGNLVGLNEALRVFLTNGKARIDGRITEILPAPIAVQTQSFISGLFALDKYSSVPALTEAVRGDHSDGRQENLRIALVPNCHVVRVGFLGDGEAPERGTRVINRIDVVVNGVPRSLSLAAHCQVVLALSCIESTRLALESFSLVDSGLRSPGDELIGRNYMVHLRADISFDVDRARFATWVSTNWPGKQLADVLQQAAVHVQCEGALGRYQYQFYAATNSAGPDSNLYSMVPDLDIQRQISDGFNATTIRIVLRASAQVKGGKAVPIGDPNFDYIDLAGASDFDSQFGHRRAYVQFNRGDHSNDAIWQDLHDTAHAIARAMNGGTPPTYGGDFTLPALKTQQGVGTTFHDAGCLWMGDDPDTSVTDVQGHFHHVTNAYCCDQGLFTTIGSANPVLTGLSLARRVASAIVDSHSGYITPAPGLAPVSLLPTNRWLQAPYNGMLVIDPANNGILATNPYQGIGLYYLPRDMGDFDLAVEWKSFRTYNGQDLMANSGVLLRTPDPAGVNFNDPTQFGAFYDSVTEIQIDDTGKQFFADTRRSVFGNSRFKTGAIYGQSSAKQWSGNVASPDGPNLGNRYWNTYEISARGVHIKVKLNGRVVSEADVVGKRLRGFVALQFHTGRVQFRNFRLNQVT